MAFRWDTRHLSPQVQQIISKRYATDRFIKENLKLERENEKKIIYPIAIFMRLGIDTYSRLNGVETLKQYENFCGVNKSVWFSTDSLATGMSEKRRTEFLNEIKTDAEGIGSPEKILTPDLWKDD